MTTTAQPWLRAELIAGPETTTPGAQLMIPADGVEFHDGQLVFHHQGEVVYVADQQQLRSITWFPKQPNPETARRKALWPNHGTRWTDEQRADLLRRLQLGQSWAAISTAAGRSRTGCQQEAVKQGWLDPDTLRPRPELLIGNPTLTSDAADAPPAAPEPIAADADRTPSPSAAGRTPPPAPTGGSATPSEIPDSSGRGSEPALTVVAAVPTDPPVPAPPPAQTAASAEHAPTDGPCELSPADALAVLLQGTDTGSSIYLGSMPSAVPMTRRDSGDSTPPRPDTPPPHPDGPQPRIPRQRTESDPLPDSGGDGGSDGGNPGNRFSSLSRAALRSYMNPSRGQPTGAP